MGLCRQEGHEAHASGDEQRSERGGNAMPRVCAGRVSVKHVLLFWIAVTTLNVRDKYRAPVVRTHRLFVAYAGCHVVVQLVGESEDVDAQATSTSTAVAKTRRSFCLILAASWGGNLSTCAPSSRDATLTSVSEPLGWIRCRGRETESCLAVSS
ncbi:hypothetical protein PsorP6_012107 [Peronosclerospora sorghi]|uniref:Uncharacterized protein n=1 Tax=Peronosclerospora sorghi TaxID=230839 RepID=A0ACC0WM91_9STRA|nr:hypothetical protein PsorP6_012107 [Peronosclerospora sorghi]